MSLDASTRSEASGRLSMPAPGIWSLAAVTLTALAFWPALADLVALWSDSDRPYSHGLLVGPVAVGLAVLVCLRSSEAHVRSSWLGLLMLAGASLLWLVGFVGNVLAVQQMLFPALLVLAVAALVGWDMARRLLFPLCFLYFAIPVWSYAVPILQSLTVGVVRFALDLVGIPVLVEGNRVTIPEGVFEIADGCAGLHYFIVALTISSLYSYLNFSRRLMQVGFVAIAGAIAVVTNWLRVGSLVLFGHYTDMQHYLITHEHYYYGWVLYALALIPTFAIARVLLGRDAGPEATTVGHDGSIAEAGVVPGPPRPAAAPATLFAVLLAAPIALVQLDANDGLPQRFEIETPRGHGGWRAAESPPGQWLPRFAGADAELAVAYRMDAARVDVYMAVYRSQSQGRELVSGDNDLSGPEYAARRVARAAVEGVTGLREVQERLLRAGNGDERLVWSWYQIRERPVAGDLDAKLWQLLPGLVGRDSGAALALSAPCGLDCAGARADLERFAAAMAESLQSLALSCQLRRTPCSGRESDISQ